MLRAKAERFKTGKVRWRDRLITSTGPVFQDALHARHRPSGQCRRGDAGAAQGHRTDQRAACRRRRCRSLRPSRSAGGVKRHRVAATWRPRLRTARRAKWPSTPPAMASTTAPKSWRDLIAVLNHNGVPVKVLKDARCCGMPKLELGDLEKVAAAKEANLPIFLNAIDAGYDLMAVIPSCVLMYKQEIPADVSPPKADVERGEAGVLRPVRVPDAPPSRRAAEHRVQAPARQGGLPSRLPSTGAEHRHEDARTPEPHRRHRSPPPSNDAPATTAPTPPRRETYAKAMKIVRPVVNRGEAGRAGPIRFRLPHGRAPGRPRARWGRRRRRASHFHGRASPTASESDDGKTGSIQALESGGLRDASPGFPPPGYRPQAPSKGAP